MSNESRTQADNERLVQQQTKDHKLEKRLDRILGVVGAIAIFYLVVIPLVAIFLVKDEAFNTFAFRSWFIVLFLAIAVHVVKDELVAIFGSRSSKRSFQQVPPPSTDSAEKRYKQSTERALRSEKEAEEQK